MIDLVRIINGESKFDRFMTNRSLTTVIKLEDKSVIRIGNQKRPWVVTVSATEVLFMRYNETGEFVTELEIMSNMKNSYIETDVFNNPNEIDYPLYWIFQNRHYKWNDITVFLNDLGYGCDRNYLHIGNFTKLSANCNIGGKLYGNTPNIEIDGYEIITDGDVEPLDHDIIIKRNGSWISKSGTIGRARVTNASYIINMTIQSTNSGKVYWYPRIWLGCRADFELIKTVVECYRFFK